MCMVAGLVLQGVAVLATDLRVNAYFSDGTPPRREDPGGKLAGFPGGFIAGTGDGALIGAVLAEVRGAQPRTVEALQTLVSSTYDYQAPRIRAALPGADPDNVRFLVTRWEVVGEALGGRLLELDAHGRRVRERAAGSYIVSWPPELEDDDPRRVEADRAFVAALGVARRLEDVADAFVNLFATASKHAPSMSAVFDAGVLGPDRQETTRLVPTGPIDRVGFDLGTVTAGTLSAGVLVASTSFTASSASFAGSISAAGIIQSGSPLLYARLIGSTTAVAFADVSEGHSGSMSLNGSGQLVFGMSSKPVISGATTADRLASTEAALAALGLTTSS